jgi:hypothetical protein
MMEPIPPICVFCKHHIIGGKCAAFEEIPEDIDWYQTNLHLEPVDGDSGITFEQKDPIPEFIFDMYPAENRRKLAEFGVEVEVL